MTDEQWLKVAKEILILCDRCDGCGWSEGDQPLGTPCIYCRGTGVHCKFEHGNVADLKRQRDSLRRSLEERDRMIKENRLALVAANEERGVLVDALMKERGRPADTRSAMERISERWDKGTKI